MSNQTLDNFDCHWSSDSFYDTVRCKKALVSLLFIFMMTYTFLVLIRWKYPATKLALKMNRLINEIALCHPFFFIASIIVHVIVPKPWAVSLIAFYVLTFSL